MSKVVTDSQHYSDIAAAIRNKTGSSDQYKPSEMAEAINALDGAPEAGVIYEELIDNGSGNPTKVRIVGDRVASHAVSYSPYLTDAVISDGIVGIGSYAFYGCKRLQNVSIPNSVTGIDVHAFGTCTELTQIRLPDGITKILDNTFNGCNVLAEINIPNSVTSIGESVFSSCAKLTSITLPNSLTSIGIRAFSSSGLKALTIPNSVTSIGNYAFSATSLSEVIVPESVTSLGEYVFYQCSKLVTATLPENMSGVLPKSLFNRCSLLNNVNIPAGITDIREYAFSGCSRLTGVTLPDGLLTIGTRSFEECSQMLFDGVVIPASVTTIGNYAFTKNSGSGNDRPITITFKGTPTSISTSGFSIGINHNSVTFNVPWSEGEVAGAPWGVSSSINVTINYNYVEE